MLQVVSKAIVALKSDPRINERFWEEIQEKLDPVGPLDPGKKQYDSGKPRLTHIDQWLGMGEEDRAPSGGVGVGLGKEVGKEDDQFKDQGLSSGYNLDQNRDQGIDDETGPGNTSQATNPYYAVDTNEEFLKMNLFESGRDKNNRLIRDKVNQILEGPAVSYHKRRPVDRSMR